MNSRIAEFLSQNPDADKFYPDEDKMYFDPDRLLYLIALIHNGRESIDSPLSAVGICSVDDCLYLTWCIPI